MSDSTRLILTGLTFGLGLAMTACGGGSPLGPTTEQHDGDLLTEAPRVPIQPADPDGSGRDGARQPEGLELR